MDRNYVIENEIVDRYLRGELSDDESAAFEEFYLSDRATLAELELAEKLEAGLRGAAEQGRLDVPPPQGRFARALTSPQWAAAASVLLVCSLGFNVFMQRQTGGAPDVASPQLIPLIATRGAAPATIVPHAPDRWVVLLADPGFDPYDDYRAAVLDPAGERVWEVAALQPGYEDLLAVGIAGSALVPGRYDLVVEARSGSAQFAEISRTTFEVR
ncbi:MAG: hypothetical protein ACN4GT_02865 [Gammaproteobacteria bacterium]